MSNKGSRLDFPRVAWTEVHQRVRSCSNAIRCVTLLSFLPDSLFVTVQATTQRCYNIANVMPISHKTVAKTKSRVSCKQYNQKEHLNLGFSFFRFFLALIFINLLPKMLVLKKFLLQTQTIVRYFYKLVTWHDLLGQTVRLGIRQRAFCMKVKKQICKHYSVN